MIPSDASPQTVPVFVPCFNNPTYTSGMVRQLRERGFAHIVLMDGGSDLLAMRALLADTGPDLSVVAMPGNPGPRTVFLSPAAYAALPRYFCLTDPDLALNPAMPPDFLADLAALAGRERMGKVGLALEIADRDAMRTEQFTIGPRTWHIWEWEEQFWRDRLEPVRPGGDPVYRAPIDTTFALYDKEYFDPANDLPALRVAGRFTCRHLPWYADSLVPEAEAAHYRRTERYSFYARSALEGRPGGA
jgi:hypothetical protein